MNTTGIFTGWVLVYRDTNIIIAQFQDGQETSTIFNLEIFQNEVDMHTRISELGLKYPELS